MYVVGVEIIPTVCKHISCGHSVQDVNYICSSYSGGRGEVGGEKILQLALSALKGTVSRDWDGFKLIPYWYSYYTKLKK